MTTMVNPIYARRRRKDIVVRGLCIAAAAFGVTWLTLILFTLFYNGLAGLSLQVFTQNTPPPGSTDGGLLNAIVGSVIMTVIGVGIGAPPGLFAAAERTERNNLRRSARAPAATAITATTSATLSMRLSGNGLSKNLPRRSNVLCKIHKRLRVAGAIARRPHRSSRHQR